MDDLVKAVGLEKAKIPLMAGRSRQLSFHAVNYILGGRGRFRDSRTPEREVGPGTVFFLYPGLDHCYDPLPGTTWKEYWVLFDGAEAERRFGPLLPATSFHQPGLIPELEWAFEELDEYAREQRAETPLLCAMSLHRILGLIFRRLREHPAPVEPVVAAAVSAMQQQIARPTAGLSQLARDYGVSYETFRKKFRQQTGRSPHDYFLNLKINAAKNLLLHGRNVKEAAAELGFADQYYFSRLFKRHSDLSPSQFSSVRRSSG